MKHLKIAIKDRVPHNKTIIAKYLLLSHKSIDLSKHKNDEYRKAKLTM